jgi:hypothetical protein
MVEKIIELRKKGYSVNQISKDVNCAKSTVSYHINKHGLGGVRYSFISDIDDKLINRIKELREQSKTYSDILASIDIPEDKLKKICRVLGLNKSIQKKKFNKEEIVNYYLSVKSLRQTSEYFNTSRGVIRSYIDDSIIIKRSKKVTNKISVINFRRRVKSKLVEYKGGCCEKCGYNKSEQVLQFHHTNPNEKDFTISGKSYSFERLKKEVDKCILVCANCHIEIHEKIRKIGM